MPKVRVRLLRRSQLSAGACICYCLFGFVRVSVLCGVLLLLIILQVMSVLTIIPQVMSVHDAIIPALLGLEKMQPKNTSGSIQNSVQGVATDVAESDSSALASAVVTPTKKPDQAIYLGLWTEGFWNDQQKKLDVDALKDIETQLGKKVAIAHYYRGWDALQSPAFVVELQAIDDAHWRPMVSANPYFFDQCQGQGLSLYKAIGQGHCDEFLAAAGKNIAAFGKPVFLRFAWEMNIDSIEWSVKRTGDTAADFIAAWRRIHDVITRNGASNALWIFSPNVKTAQGTPYQELYPGDEYVDWLGLDGYNWGTTQPWSLWQTFSQIFQSSYTEITKLAPSKPVMIAEVNSATLGGDRAVWYHDMMTILPHAFPKVTAVVFYNEDRTNTEHVNWLFSAENHSLLILHSALQSPLFSSAYSEL